MGVFRELHRRTSIKTKGILYVMLLVVVIFLSVSVIVLSSARRNLLSQLKQFQGSIAEKLALNASDAIISDDYGFLMEQIRQLKSSGQIRGISVIDVRGTVIASDDLQKIGRSDKNLLSELRSYLLKGLKGTSPGYDIFMPVEVGGDHLGALGVNFDTEAEEAALRRDFKRTIVQLIYLSLIIFAAGIGGSYVVSLVITRPIRNLSREMEEFEREIETGGSNLYDAAVRDETVQLRQSFYHMIENLRRYLNGFRRVSEEKNRLACMATIGQMSSQVAHEIRNSLYAISGAISGIERSREISEIREYIEIIKDETREMTVMADRFLRFGRVPTPNFIPCNLPDVLKRVMELLESDLKESGVRVVSKVGEGVSEMMGDPALLKQVFMNLFINAIQAMRNGGVITVEMKEVDGWLEVTVRDTGPGIDKEIVSKIFQPFFTTRADGSGLGLATVYKIVLVHHGEIRLMESESGAEFLIRLPLRDNIDAVRNADSIDLQLINRT